MIQTILTHRRAFHHLMMLWISTVGVAGLAFCTQVILGRHLSVSDYGLIVSAMGVIAILIPFGTSGLPGTILLIFGEEGWKGVRWIKPAIFYLVIVSTLVCLLALVISKVLEDSFPIMQVAKWMLLLIIMQSLLDLRIAFFQLENYYGYASIAQVLPHLGRFLVALACLVIASGTADAIFVAKGYMLFALFLILMVLFSFKSVLEHRLHLVGHVSSRIKNGDASPSLKHVFHRSSPFFLNGVLVIALGRTDVVILGTLSSPDNAGYYGVAMAILTLVFMLPQVIFTKYLQPKLHRWANSDERKFLSIYRLGCGQMLFLGLLAMTGVIFFGRDLLLFLFGTKYQASGDLISLIAICIPFRYLSSCMGGILATRNYMKQKVRYQGLVLIISIILNFTLIPFFGFWGAVIAKIGTEVSLFCCYLFGVYTNVFGRQALQGWRVSFGN